MRAPAVFIALLAIAVAACGPGEPRTDAERLTRGRELVRQGSTRLAAIPQFRVTTAEERDVVRPGGGKERMSMTNEYVVRRPDRFHSKMTGGRGLETWYDGKVVTVALHAEKVFAQAPMPENIDRTIDVIVEPYDIPLALGDLVYSSPEKRAAL